MCIRDRRRIVVCLKLLKSRGPILNWLECKFVGLLVFTRSNCWTEQSEFTVHYVGSYSIKKRS